MPTGDILAAVTTLGAAGVMMASLAGAAEINVIGSPATREPYTQLVPSFEKATGHKVTTIWAGVVETTRRVAEGEIADVVMLPAPQIEQLIRQGKIVPDSRVDVATSGIGVAVRAGAAPIDIRSGDSIKKAMLAANKIAYSTGPSGVHIARLIEKWGIADELKPKIAAVRPNTPIGEVVARGDAEIGFQQVSELLPVKGITYLGPLPADIQEVTVFSAGIHTNASAAEPGRALLRFLTAAEAAAVIRKAGMEPGSR